MSRTKVVMVRSVVKAENLAEMEAGAQKLFEAIEAAQPGDVQYVSWVLPDRVTLMTILAHEDDTDNPLEAMPAFKEFHENLESWVAWTSTSEPVQVIGSYGLFAR